ncbi:glycosyltransferase family 2 protein [Nocardioides zeae]|uniref:Glycosyltransferase family 2 protein n=1 Tax=Nocardioides imazamoxiresistens TaxID=3231893 RepID=A0ABU3Q0L0_9ACTN|nr:glycosyltransferase family 2 protein [Nocardioides zeae]MDT9594929.1 glycosyltransferase family 2 protein [Nocardioides zeae]
MSEPVEIPEPADHWADLRDDELPAAAPVVLDGSGVTVLLVSHDGATWLPTVLDALAQQSVEPARVVAVDTGSTDGTGELLDTALGHENVHELPAATPFGAAVTHGLGHLAPGTEWVWILHDDAAPAPDALQRLLECAAAEQAAGARVDAVGPKLREWPSLRRLLEVGVTISGTARRETGLERGEYDQGQYDASRRVLAVNSAGMLVRPGLLEDLGGFSEDLPVLGTDLDLGWRAAAAGRRIVVAPEAVVFHAEAGHRGLRPTSLVGAHPHQTERRAQVLVVLANASTRLFVPAYLRLVVGAVLRAIGFLLTRRPGTALDEVAAVLSVCLRPGELRRARAARRGTRTVPDAEIRPLLAPWWLPFRHGLDAAGDLLGSLTSHASDVADRRRDARAAAERDRVAATRAGTRAAHPGTEDDDELAAESGWLARYLTSPVALTLTAVVLLLLVGAREAFGAVSGGALAPAPDSTGAWWSLHLASWHPIGTGSEVPAPPYVAPLAVLAWLLPGGPVTTVSVLLVASLPLSLWGAWRLLGVATRLVDPAGASPWLLGVGAVTYALLPVTSGAWADGRFGVVLGAALLPWLVHAALGFADPERERRWRAGWRTGLLLTLLVALVPAAWWLVVGVVGAIAVFAFVLVGRTRLLRRDVRTGVLAPVGVALATPAVLLAPWLLPTLLQGDLVALVGEAGRLPYGVVAPTDLLWGHLGADAAPAWLGLVLVVAAVLALLVPTTRIAVVGCWAVAFAVAAPASLLAIPVFSLAPGDTPSAVGFAVVVLQGVAVVAAVLGVLGLRHLLGVPSTESGVRRLLAALPVVALAAVAGTGLAWFVGPGAGIVEDDRDAVIPAYMAQRSVESPSYGVLVVDGTIRDGVTFTVRREDGLRLGEEEIAALEPRDAEMVATVRQLVSYPSATELDRLREEGISYIVLPAPGDPAIRATLDSIAGLAPASAPDPQTRAWELVDQPGQDAVPGPSTGVLRWLLLAVQLGAAGVVLVMAGPSRPGGDRPDPADPVAAALTQERR